MISDQHLWGESWTIYRDKSVWVVGFRGHYGGASSFHSHSFMSQCFYVTSGKMILAGHTYQAMLCSGDVHSWDSDEPHKIEFWQDDTEGIETYYALPGHEIDENDIVRLSPGRAPGDAPA